MTRAAEQAAEALRNIIENSVPTTSMWMDAQTRQQFDWIEKTATEALAALTAEAGGATAECIVQSGMASVSDGPCPRCGEGPCSAPVSPDREALARELDAIVDQRRIAQAHVWQPEREDFDASPEARAAAFLRAPAQAEVEAMAIAWAKERDQWMTVSRGGNNPLLVVRCDPAFPPKWESDKVEFTGSADGCRHFIDVKCAEAVCRLSLSPAVGAGWRPIAWMLSVHTPSTPHGPSEWDVEFAYGDRPEGAGWVPLYADPLPLSPAPEEAK